MTADLRISDTPTHGRAGELSVLMIAPQPFFRSRGTPFSVLHRIRALLLLGHRIDLVTYPFGEGVALEGLNIIRCGRPPFVRDVRIGPSVAKLLLDVPLYLAARRQLKLKQYDVIHSHEEAAFFSAGLAAKYGIRHIYDMHSSLPQQLENFDQFNYGAVRRLFRRLERRVLNSCDGVITICEDLARTVESFGVDVPHSMIENTGDNTKISPARDVDVVSLHGLRDRKIVLYTGTFEPYQGLDLLVEAFAQVVVKRSDAHLLMVGGRPRQVDAMGKSVRALGLDGAVTLTGTVPSTEIPSYLRSAHVIVSPRTRGTNTPLKVYEYMRSGVPIVATDMYTHTQTLDRDIAHLVPVSAAGMANGILRLLDDRVYADKLVAACLARANESYSDSAYLERVARFYGTVFRSSRGCNPAESLSTTSHS